MCLDWKWITGLVDKAIAEILSQYIIGVNGIGTCKSQNNCLVQASSTAVIARALYSTFVEDLETIFYFSKPKKLN